MKQGGIINLQKKKRMQTLYVSFIMAVGMDEKLQTLPNL